MVIMTVALLSNGLKTSKPVSPSPKCL